MKTKILLSLMLGILVFNLSYANETEPNDNWNQANKLNLNGSNNGVINPAGDVDWYKVTTTGDGALTLTLNVAGGKPTYFALYDTLGTILLHQDYISSTYSYSVDGLAKGTYYIKIFCYYSSDTSSYTISNSLAVPSQANDAEPDSTRSTALVLPLNGSVTGHIGYYFNNHLDTTDEYKVTTNADGALRLTLSVANGTPVYFGLYDNNGNTLLHLDYTASNYSYTVDGLAAGTYYVKVFCYYNSQFAPYTLSDSLFKPAEANDNEPDSTKGTALVLPLNGSKTGHIGYYFNNHLDTTDEYKVTTNADGALRLTLNVANGTPVYFGLYDNDGNTLLHLDYTASNFSYTVDGLAAGTYYVKVFCYYNSQFAPYTLSDSLFKPAEANDAEPDSTKATALLLPLNGSVTGHIGYYYNNHRDTVDEYKLTTTADGDINLNLTIPNGTPVYFDLLDNDGVTVLHHDYTTSNFSYDVDGLAAGTYYVKVYCYYNSQFAPYTLKDTLYTYNANDVEPNNFANLAKTLPANTTSNGHVGFYYNNMRDTVDWFKINYTGTGNLSVTLSVLPHVTGGANPTYMQIYKDTSSSPIYSDYTSSSITANLTGLTQGYYYVRVFEYYNSQFEAYTITDSFTQTKARIKVLSYDTLASCSPINTITYKLSKSSAPYTVQLYRFGIKYGSAVIVKSTKVVFDSLPEGSYFATVYGDGATGSAKGKSDTLNLIPSPTNPVTTNVRNTQAKLNWTTVSCADYYSIQYRVHGTSDWSVVTTTGNTGSYVLKNLTPSTSYDWEVASVDSSNGIIATGAYTDSVVFTTSSSLIASFDNGSEQKQLNTNNKTSNDNNNDVVLYPNPASSQFRIQWNSVADKSNTTVSLTLKDFAGKTVWSASNVNSLSVNNMNVDVSKLQSGVYLLQIINSDNSVITKKLIVSR